MIISEFKPKDYTVDHSIPIITYLGRRKAKEAKRLLIKVIIMVLL